MYAARERAGLGLGLGLGLELELGLGIRATPPLRSYAADANDRSSIRILPEPRHTSFDFGARRCFDMNKARKNVSFDHRIPPSGRSQSANRFRGGSYSDNGKTFYGNCANNDNNIHSQSNNHGDRRRRSGSSTKFSRPLDAMEPKGAEKGDLDVLLRRLSVLQLEMKDLLQGRSLRERLQIIGQTTDNNNNNNDVRFSALNDNPAVGSSSCSSGSSSASSSGRGHHQKDKSRLKEKDNESKGLPQHHSSGLESEAKKHCMSKTGKEGRGEENDDDDNTEEDGEGCVSMRREDNGSGTSTNNEDKESKCGRMGTEISEERKQIIRLWQEYNCDLHLKRIIDVSRKDAAFKMLEKVIHSRLTCYMLQYIAAVAKGLMGDEKTHYLSFFKREGPFRTKPLNEGTYGELLSFVCKQANPAKDVVKALEVSEEGLEEEGGRAGYSPNAIGNVRAQMRVFLSIAAAYGNAVASHAESIEELLTCEFLKDIIQAANQGKLGALQNAHQLIKLACFLVLKQLDVS